MASFDNPGDLQEICKTCWRRTFGGVHPQGHSGRGERSTFFREDFEAWVDDVVAGLIGMLPESAAHAEKHVVRSVYQLL